ncbi:hypothetical protein [Paenibacillus sp. 32O-W]|uniref:hypothetical protein n=1 Tax=Paenibacillus sp. 32O-W TaxID=1695218 RepID=UPI0011AE8429|nr:hypothetical protein [Paenibacillus sp. 32O-W]
MVAGFLHFYIIFPWPGAFLMKFLRKYIIFTLNYQNIGGGEQKNCIIAGISPPVLGLRVNSCTFAPFKSSMNASHHCESSMTASNHSIKPQQPQAITTQYGRGLPHRASRDSKESVFLNYRRDECLSAHFIRNNRSRSLW